MSILPYENQRIVLLIIVAGLAHFAVSVSFAYGGVKHTAWFLLSRSNDLKLVLVGTASLSLQLTKSYMSRFRIIWRTGDLLPSLSTYLLAVCIHEQWTSNPARRDCVNLGRTPHAPDHQRPNNWQNLLLLAKLPVLST